MESYFGYHSGGRFKSYGLADKNNKLVNGQEPIGSSSTTFIIPTIQVPEPEVERRISIRPELSQSTGVVSRFVEPKCKDEYNIKSNAFGVFEDELIMSGQQGYKTRNFKTQGPSGVLGAFNKCGLEEANGMASNFSEVKSVEESKLSADAINDSKSQYKYGYESQAPNNGLYLPGSQSILLKGHADSEDFVYPKLRSGAKISGYYAGYQSAATAVDKTLRDHENVAL